MIKMNEYYFQEHFKKIFEFTETTKYILPVKSFISPKWFIPELQSKKKKLNDVKSMLSKYKLKEWSRHTALRDPAGFVMKKVSQIAHPELLTHAWCKFYEILCQFPAVPEHAILKKEFRSIHLCEAPGAFVCSLNHFMTNRYPEVQWKWMATTLNPNYEGNELSQMIPDDRFIRYTMKNWYFGDDFTGDIQKYYNYLGIVDNDFCKNKVNLVSADGSIDCMKDPGEQEKQVEYLHFAETITALNILRPGGTYILKIFTIFEESTINLLYLLNCTFERVSVFKPCSSKSGNSEVYVINLNFKGIHCLNHHLMMSKFMSVFTEKNIFDTTSMFAREDIPEEFISDILNCTNFFMEKQSKTILDNIYHFENRTNDHVFTKKTTIANMFVEYYWIQPIPSERKLLPHIDVPENWRVHPALNRRQVFNCMAVSSVIKEDLTIDLLQIIVGKQIGTVKNSKFTHKDNLRKLTCINIQQNGQTELYDRTLHLLEDKNIVINMRSYNVHLFYKFQRNIFDSMYKSLKSDKNIILIGIPFVTHFLLGIFYILMHSFREICFSNGLIILYQKESNSIESVSKLFSIIHEKYQLIDLINEKSADNFYNKDIMQVVHPYHFDQDNNALLNYFWNYNNHLFNSVFI